MTPSRHNWAAGRMRLAVPVLVTAFGCGFVGVTLMPTQQRYVAAPAIACTVIMLWCTVALWERDRVVPLFDIGFLCVLATFAYSVYPLINYWLHGFQFGNLSDGRLSTYGPGIEEIGRFHFRHVLYLSCLAVTYLWFRGRGPIWSGNVEPPPEATRYAILVLFVALSVYFIALRATTGIVFASSYDPVAFAGKVAAFARAPLLLLQVSGKLAGILFVLKLALLYIVVSRCRHRRWRIILALWIVAEVIHAIVLKGPRSAMILFLMTTVLLYHRLIRPFSFKVLVISGTAVFALFTFIGFYRSFDNLAALMSDIRTADAGIFARSNEFQSLLGTAYDVAQRKAAGATLPWYLYINDFIDILPPQQLLPFAKVSAPEWYVRELGASGTGQGYMWGVITQSIVGLDWIELALRGAVLGILLGWFHRWYRRRQSGFMETFVYVYLCIHIYSTFRNTTFSILAHVVWELIPFYLIATVSAALMPTGHRRSHPTSEAVPAVGTLP